MTRLREGARWHLRVAIALVLAFDLALLAGMLSSAERTPRTLAGAPSILLALIGRPELALPIAALGIAALARFALGPGRPFAALVALLATGVLCEAKAAASGGPERFLFAGGTVLAGWLAGLAFVRAGAGDRDAEEIGAEAGAIGALSAMYVNAALAKLLASGLGWADGDDLRMLVLSQRLHGGGGFVADLVVGSRTLAFLLAAFTELAQASAIVFPFFPRARPVIGSMLLAFHAGVRLVTPITFPQHMALLAVLSYPWRALFERRGIVPRVREDLVLARRPARGALAVASAFAVLAALAFLPPVRATILSLSHVSDRPSAPPRVEAPRPPPFDATAAASAGIERPGARISGCAAVRARRSGDTVELAFACPEGELVVELVPSGSRPHRPPASAGGRDLFYRSGSRVPARRRDALLEALADNLE